MPNTRSIVSFDAHIESLENKHSQLEAKLHEAEQHTSSADFELKMLKRRKLYIKDEIELMRTLATEKKTNLC